MESWVWGISEAGKVSSSSIKGCGDLVDDVDTLDIAKAFCAVTAKIRDKASMAPS